MLALRRDLRSAAPAAAAASGPGATERPAEGRLLVLDGGDGGLASGQTVPLRAETLIGRAPDSDIRVDDRLVSARHARLARRDGHWVLADLGSTNGTLLNERPVEGEQEVEYGDVIVVGSARLKMVR
jgi:hypothetical protein